MQLHPIPEHFQGADGPQDSARSWAALSLWFPELGWAPGTRQVPNKVVRAQERSCHTRWPWGAPCSLCCQQGSESGTNPAKTAQNPQNNPPELTQHLSERAKRTQQTPETPSHLACFSQQTPAKLRGCREKELSYDSSMI